MASQMSNGAKGTTNDKEEILVKKTNHQQHGSNDGLDGISAGSTASLQDNPATGQENSGFEADSDIVPSSNFLLDDGKVMTTQDGRVWKKTNTPPMATRHTVVGQSAADKRPPPSAKTVVDQNSNGKILASKSDQMELVTMNPHSKAEGVKNGKNGSALNGDSAVIPPPQKLGTVDVEKGQPDGDAYKGYYLPVNTHRKFLRGEKLYLTQDQRSSNRSWRKIVICGAIWTFIAAIFLTAALAATGIIASKPSASLGEANQLSRTNGTEDDVTPLVIGTDIPPPLATGSPPAGTRTLQGRLEILNLEFMEALNNVSSPQFRSLAGHVENELYKVFVPLDIWKTKVDRFRPGSVVVDFLLAWAYSDSVMSPQQVYEHLFSHLMENKGYLEQYLVNISSVSVHEPISPDGTETINFVPVMETTLGLLPELETEMSTKLTEEETSPTRSPSFGRAMDDTTEYEMYSTSSSSTAMPFNFFFTEFSTDTEATTQSTATSSEGYPSSTTSTMISVVNPGFEENSTEKIASETKLEDHSSSSTTETTAFGGPALNLTDDTSSFGNEHEIFATELNGSEGINVTELVFPEIKVSTTALNDFPLLMNATDELGIVTTSEPPITSKYEENQTVVHLVGFKSVTSENNTESGIAETPQIIVSYEDNTTFVGTTNNSSTSASMDSEPISESSRDPVTPFTFNGSSIYDIFNINSTVNTTDNARSVAFGRSMNFWNDSSEVNSTSYESPSSQTSWVMGTFPIIGNTTELQNFSLPNDAQSETISSKSSQNVTESTLNDTSNLIYALLLNETMPGDLYPTYNGTTVASFNQTSYKTDTNHTSNETFFPSRPFEYDSETTNNSSEASTTTANEIGHDFTNETMHKQNSTTASEEYSQTEFSQDWNETASNRNTSALNLTEIVTEVMLDDDNSKISNQTVSESPVGRSRVDDFAFSNFFSTQNSTEDLSTLSSEQFFVTKDSNLTMVTSNETVISDVSENSVTQNPIYALLNNTTQLSTSITVHDKNTTKEEVQSDIILNNDTDTKTSVIFYGNDVINVTQSDIVTDIISESSTPIVTDKSTEDNTTHFNPIEESFDVGNSNSTTIKVVMIGPTMGNPSQESTTLMENSFHATEMPSTVVPDVLARSLDDHIADSNSTDNSSVVLNAITPLSNATNPTAHAELMVNSVNNSDVTETTSTSATSPINRLVVQFGDGVNTNDTNTNDNSTAMDSPVSSNASSVVANSSLEPTFFARTTNVTNNEVFENHNDTGAEFLNVRDSKSTSNITDMPSTMLTGTTELTFEETSAGFNSTFTSITNSSINPSRENEGNVSETVSTIGTISNENNVTVHSTPEIPQNDAVPLTTDVSIQTESSHGDITLLTTTGQTVVESTHPNGNDLVINSTFEILVNSAVTFATDASTQTEGSANETAPQTTPTSKPTGLLSSIASIIDDLLDLGTKISTNTQAQQSSQSTSPLSAGAGVEFSTISNENDLSTSENSVIGQNEEMPQGRSLNNLSSNSTVNETNITVLSDVQTESYIIATDISVENTSKVNTEAMGKSTQGTKVANEVEDKKSHQELPATTLFVAVSDNVTVSESLTTQANQEASSAVTTSDASSAVTASDASSSVTASDASSSVTASDSSSSVNASDASSAVTASDADTTIALTTNPALNETAISQQTVSNSATSQINDAESIRNSSEAGLTTTETVNNNVNL